VVKNSQWPLKTVVVVDLRKPIQSLRSQSQSICCRKEHVTALETAVQAEKPDTTQLRTHATALLNQLEQMSKMHGSKPRK
jgi:hypothetical protein